MNGCLMFSSVGEFRPGQNHPQTLVIHHTIACDARLDTQDIAIHTQWILFDEPLVSRIGVWTDPDASKPLFEVTRLLEPEPFPETLARLYTVSVRLRREILVPAHLYWVKVFGDGELVTQYPIKLGPGEEKRPSFH
jgi:hypothetical protein